jgi:TRAP-type C4-dicarboxylate transport system permease small subunit
MSMLRFRPLLDRVLDGTINVLFVVLVVFTSAQVLWRYVLNDPLTWTEEAARYLFVWLVFLATCAAFRDGRHMTADLFLGFLSPRVRRAQVILIRLIIAAFLILLLVVAPEILNITLDQTSATLSIPIALVYLAFPFSALLMLLYLLIDAAEAVRDWRKTR